MSKRSIQTIVNGRSVAADVDPRTSLADFLRHQLGLTGTHLGCEHGVCGACTVIVDHRPVRSCLMLAVQIEGMDIETVESLGAENDLSTLQRAFTTEHALQCGFCTPGILMTLEAYLREEPNPTREQIRDVLSGNLCRCTGYQNIVDAALSAANARRNSQ